MKTLKTALLLCLLPAGRFLGDGPLRPVISMFTVCSGLNNNHYPQDSLNWFDPTTHSQIVLFAHLLFPLRPELEDKNQNAAENAARPTVVPPPKDWHPPLVFNPKPVEDKAPLTIAVDDLIYAEAEWFAPDGTLVASLGNTLPARLSTDYIRLKGRLFIPHTFAMAIGIRDLRALAGQKALPSQKGLYHIKLFVDGRLEGVAFFSMLEGQAAAVTTTPGMPEKPAPEDTLSPPFLPWSVTRSGAGKVK